MKRTKSKDMEGDTVTDNQRAVRATGHCLCGAVKYTVRGPLRSAVVACHCENCRRFTGGLWTGTTARREHVVIEDQGHLRWYQTTPNEKGGRGFCSTCGSSLFWDGSVGLMAIAAGSLDEPTGLKLAVHSWTSESADYWSFDPSIPRESESSGLGGPEQ